MAAWSKFCSGNSRPHNGALLSTETETDRIHHTDSQSTQGTETLQNMCYTILIVKEGSMQAREIELDVLHASLITCFWSPKPKGGKGNQFHKPVLWPPHACCDTLASPRHHHTYSITTCNRVRSDTFTKKLLVNVYYGVISGRDGGKGTMRLARGALWAQAWVISSSTSHTEVGGVDGHLLFIFLFSETGSYSNNLVINFGFFEKHSNII